MFSVLAASILIIHFKDFWMDVVILDFSGIHYLGLLCVRSSLLSAEDRVAFQLMVDQSEDRLIRKAEDFMRNYFGLEI